MALGVSFEPAPAELSTDPEPGTRLRRSAPLILGLVFSLLYSLLSALRYYRFGDTSWDLGIFEEAVRHYAHFQAPIVDIKGPGFNILGDHFSPLLAILAPTYWIYPSAVSLLVAQGFLLGMSVVPIARAAVRALGFGSGIGIGIAYGLAWGLQRAADNTFHEVALAVPLLALCLERLLDRRWKSAFLWCLPLVLVKEDLGLTVAAIGAYLILQRQQRLGLAAVAFGTGMFALTLEVLIPAMNPSHQYAYWNKVGSGGGMLSSVFNGADVKLDTVVVIFGVTGLLALRSPLSILVLPTLGWRFVSTDTDYWGTAWHYNAVLMPIVFAALIDAIVKSKASERRLLREYASHLVPVVVGIAVTFTLAGNLPLKDLTDSSSYSRGSRGPAELLALSEIPDNASVETNMTLISHLSGRCDVYWVGAAGNVVPEYVVLDLWAGWSSPINNPVGYAESLHAGVQYTMIANDQGLAVMKQS